MLFDQLGMPKTKRTKTGYTTDADALADLFAKTEHPFLEALLRHRDTARLRVTVEGLIKSVAPDRRIHTTYIQTIAATGRLSSTDPNLQNVPIRTEEGRRIREVFVVGEGYESLMSADYSQIEMRIMAHLSGDEGLIEAFRTGEDLHRFVGARVFHVEPEDVTPAMRSKVKAMSYGLAYGLSAFGLSKQLTISTGEAQGLMDEYFARFGGVRDYLREVVAEARATGYTATMLGRRRYLPDLTSDNRQRREGAERMALNAPIQGSAADIIKLAMKGVDAALTAEGLRVAHPAPGARRARARGGAGGARGGRGAGAPRDGRGRRDGRAARRQRGGRSELARRRALGTSGSPGVLGAPGSASSIRSSVSPGVVGPDHGSAQVTRTSTASSTVSTVSISSSRSCPVATNGTTASTVARAPHTHHTACRWARASAVCTSSWIIAITVPSSANSHRSGCTAA